MSGQKSGSDRALVNELVIRNRRWPEKIRWPHWSTNQAMEPTMDDAAVPEYHRPLDCTQPRRMWP